MEIIWPEFCGSCSPQGLSAQSSCVAGEKLSFTSQFTGRQNDIRWHTSCLQVQRSIPNRSRSHAASRCCSIARLLNQSCDRVPNTRAQSCKTCCHSVVATCHAAFSKMTSRPCKRRAQPASRAPSSVAPANWTSLASACRMCKLRKISCANDSCLSGRQHPPILDLLTGHFMSTE